MKIHKNIILLASTIISTSLFIGCSKIDGFLGSSNRNDNYFDFVNENNITKISVQSTRDPGFKFIVTKGSAITNTSNLLTKSKIAKEKSQLEPDYKFEFYTRDEIQEFYYVVGSDSGNFYNDENIFTTSSRLDEGIIQNLSFIRQPRDFQYIYYESILKLIEKLKYERELSEYKIGVNITGDIDCLKYVYSIDIEKFLKNANGIIPNVSMVNNNENDFDLVLTLENRGYDSTTYKTRVIVNDRKNNIIDNYYILGLNEYNSWDIIISEMNKRPEKW